MFSRLPALQCSLIRELIVKMITADNLEHYELLHAELLKVTLELAGNRVMKSDPSK